MYFSIIIAAYNAEEYLERCLLSVLNQTFNDYEVVLINDGSNDNTENICGRFREDKKLKYYYKENSGVVEARNYGFNKASGQYILYVDADDYIENNLLSNIYEYNKDRALDIVFYGYVIEYPDKKIEKRAGIFNQDEIIREMIDNNILNFTWSKVYKKETAEANGIKFDNNVKYGEDLLYIIELLKYTNNVGYFDYIGYHYVINGNSITNNDSTYSLKDYFYIESRYLDFLDTVFEKNNKYIDTLNNELGSIVALWFRTLIANRFTYIEITRLYNSHEYKSFFEQINHLSRKIKKKNMRISIFLKGYLGYITWKILKKIKRK